MARVFTLEEARATLPQVKELMERAQHARRELIRLRPELWPTLQKAALNGGSREAGDALMLFQELERSVKGIMALGVIVKDVDMGLVDFLALRDGREIYLCWHYGEDEIGYWHDIHAGLAGRMPLDDLIA
jgi:hypothetical protein